MTSFQEFPLDESPEADWHDIGEPSEFPDGAAWPVVVNGVEIAVFREGAELFALRDLCTHGAAKLSDGFIENGCIECPLHQGCFDLRTGVAVKAPAEHPVQTYPIRINNERVQLLVEPQQ